jgi:hypothetical protein
MPFNIITLDAESTSKLQNITSIYNSMESALTTMVGDGREKIWAITHLEQSHMWLVKAIEREQLEKNFRSGQTAQAQPTPEVSQPAPNLSSDAKVLADSRQKLDSLLDSIKELTNTVAVKGFPIPSNKG